MKKFVTPDLVSLDVNETANGFFDTEFETLFLLNDSNKAKESTPNDSTNMQS